MQETLIVDRQDGVCRLTLNRPQKLNALTGEMYALLEAAFRDAAADPAVRVVLIRGQGGNFTSGNDLADFAGWLADGRSLPELPVAKFIHYLPEFDKPLVAAVQGAAVGFGTTLLLHCDAVFAAPSARFSLPFARLGLVPEFGSSLLLPALAGRARASHWLLSGAAFGIAEAREMGIVSAIADDDELEAAALAYCADLTRLPASALRAIKRLLSPAEQRERLQQAIDRELEAFAAGLRTPEHQEAVQAFQQKRKPDFSGFD